VSDQIWVALIGVIGVIVGAFLQNRYQQRKVRAKTKKSIADAEKSTAEANSTITETVMSLLEPLRKRVEELELKVGDLQLENSSLKDWAEALVCQVKDLGGIPVEFKDHRKGKK
jgi:hypothetical protein